MKNIKPARHKFVIFVAAPVLFSSFFLLSNTATGQNNPDAPQNEERSWWNRIFGENNADQNQDDYMLQNEVLRRLDEDEQFRNSFVDRLKNDASFRRQFLESISQTGMMGRIFADSFANDPQWRNDLLDKFQNDAAFRRAYLRQLDQWGESMMNGMMRTDNQYYQESSTS